MAATLLAATNLCTNPSFEVSTAGWSTTAGTGLTGTLAIDAAQAWTGTKAGKHAITANTAAANIALTSTMVISGIVPGDTYGLAARFQPTNANLIGQLTIIWKDAGSATVQTDVLKATAQTLNAWNYLELDVIAPATAATATIELQTVSSASGNLGSIWWDGIDFRDGNPDVYVDGSLGTGFAWLGTAHLSASVRSAAVATVGRGHSGIIRYTASMWLADQNNTQLQQLAGVVTGQVSASIDSVIPMELSGSFSKTQTFTPYRDLLAPFLRLDYEDGSYVSRQLGLYVVLPAARQATEAFQTQAIKAYDLTWLLSVLTLTDSFTIKANQEPVSIAKSLLATYGFTRVSIPNSPYKAGADKPWPVGTAIGKVVNDLMEMGGLYSVWADNTGQLTSIPYIDGTQAVSAVSYTSDPGGKLLGAILFDPTTRDIANQVTVLVDDPARAIIKSVKTNNDPNSDTSTVTLGTVTQPRVISWLEKNSKLANQTVADATAKQILQERSNLYVKCDITTLPDPMRDLHEYYALNFFDQNSNSLVTGQWQVRGWTLKLQPDQQPMVHHLSKLQSIAQVS